MNITIEDLESVLRAIKPSGFELTKSLAFRTAMSTVKVGQVLAEARRRGFVATKESANVGYYEHVVQNKGVAFLEWVDVGRHRDYL